MLEMKNIFLYESVRIERGEETSRCLFLDEKVWKGTPSSHVNGQYLEIFTSNCFSVKCKALKKYNVNYLLNCHILFQEQPDFTQLA